MGTSTNFSQDNRKRVTADTDLAKKVAEIDTTLTNALQSSRTNFRSMQENLAAMDKSQSDKQAAKGTETQTVKNKTQVFIPHGIPENAAIPATSRQPKLNPVSDNAFGFIMAWVDKKNIIVEYDVALVTEENGWVMQWEL